MTLNSKRLVYFQAWMDPVAERLLRAAPEIDLVRLEYDAPESDNWAVLERAHGYQIQPRTELRHPYFGDPALIARCPDLLAISSSGAGYDMVDVDACTAAGILVCNQSGTNKEAVAEHALGLILALSKQIVRSDRAMRRVQGLSRHDYVGNDIRGKTIGIVGIGQIGTRTAELCRGLFGMRVLAYDPYLTAEEIVARGGEKVGFDELLARADFVCVHCPRTSETFGMFGLAEFARMQRHAYFVNTARGGLHKEDDLAKAIADKLIAGAGVDVFLDEPPPTDHPLFGFDNVIASPHIAGMTKEAMHDMAAAAAEQWMGIFRGERPPRLANPEVWPRYAERFERIIGIRVKE